MWINRLLAPGALSILRLTRLNLVQRKKSRAAEEERNIQAGNPGDVDFIGMVRKWREDHADAARPHSSEHPRLSICVRKRPLSDKERDRKDHDSVTCLNPDVWIHSAKLKVDGISKYLDHTSFRFDHAFDESTSTEKVYQHAALPLLDHVCAGGRTTVFCYGQTGSGKTYTMNGIQELLCHDLFALLDGRADVKVMVSFFEMYGGMMQDLLNDRKRLKILEDAKGEINVTGLQQVEATSPARLLEIVEEGNQQRTTHSTQANDTSSRSHAICQIHLRGKVPGKALGKLSLVDLAGSERGSDTQSHNAQRRAESADINTSLLALKECVRALNGGKHVPYRGSKLTLILKDCFTSADALTTMIATVSPGASSADHSLNTLRYADRIKEQRVKTPVRRQTKPSPKKSSPLKATSPKDSDISHSNSRESLFAKSSSLDRDLDDVLGDDEPIASQPASADEEELRRTVQALFEQEEAILSMHMRYATVALSSAPSVSHLVDRNIQENAELLTEEGKILRAVQQEGATEKEIDEYVATLETVLNRKEEMILSLQDKLVVFSEYLEKENELSRRVRSLPQY